MAMTAGKSYLNRILSSPTVPRVLRTGKFNNRKKNKTRQTASMTEEPYVPPRLSKPVKLWRLISEDNATAQQASDSPLGDSPGRRRMCGLWHGLREPSGIVQHPTDVACLGMYTFAVVDSESHQIIIIDIERNICSCIATGQVWPNGIAVTSDSKLIVTDRKDKTIKTYDTRGDLVSVWDPGEDVVQQPHGVAVTGKGEVVVTDTGLHKALVFSPEGKLLRKFGSKGNLLQQLHLPFYCAVNNKDEILISDNMNYCVKIFDAQGNYRRKLGSGNTFGQRQFQCPYGLCVDPWTDEVLVTDYDTNKIFAFDSEGAFKGYAVPTGGEEGVQGPTGVALGPCGIMAVTEYTPDGANVKAFRLYESRDGNYNIAQNWTSRIESAV